VAVYERTEATTKNQIYIYNSTGQVQVTTAGPGTETLGSYAVGGDTDPDYSPDARSIVFRRLTATGNGGLGTWDVMTVRTDRTALATLASGPVYRSAPDWGPKGIVFSEIDKATGIAQLVIVQPDGTGRRVIATLNGFDIASPRWVPRP
jgi:Tol biopolymer transport system component